MFETDTAPLTVGALERRLRHHTLGEFLHVLDCPLLVQERAPPVEAAVDGAFQTLVMTNPFRVLPRPERPVIPLRKIDGRNPFATMVTIGRAPNNDVVLRYESISKFHAYVWRDIMTGLLGIVDAGSANGTFVAGHRLPTGTTTPLRLRDDATVEVAFGESLLFSLYSPAGFWSLALGRMDTP